MSTRIALFALVALLTLAVAAPAHAEDRATVRAAIDAAASVDTSSDRLVRYEKPQWQELATQAGCCAPEPVCDPCCIDYQYPCGNPCEWHGVVSLLLWVPGIEGDVTARGRDAEISTTPGDIIDNLDKIEFIFQGRIAVYRGKWGFELSGMTVRFEDSLDFQEAGNTVTGELGIDMFSATANYCFHRCPLEVGCDPRCKGFTSYEVYAGIRYYHMKVGLDGTVGARPPVEQTKTWVDPIVGLKGTWMLGNKWGFDAQADVGGFGAGSDFSWSLRAAVHYRPWQIASFELGFNLVDVDYTEGSGANRFKFDALVWGPYFAVNFFF